MLQESVRTQDLPWRSAQLHCACIPVLQKVQEPGVARQGQVLVRLRQRGGEKSFDFPSQREHLDQSRDFRLQDLGADFPFRVKCHPGQDDRHDPEWRYDPDPSYRIVCQIRDPCKSDQDCHALMQAGNEKCLRGESSTSKNNADEVVVSYLCSCELVMAPL